MEDYSFDQGFYKIPDLMYIDFPFAQCPIYITGEGLFNLLTREGDSERMFDLIQTRFNYMKKRDQQFKGAPESPKSPTPVLPVRQYENNIVPPQRQPSATKSPTKVRTNSLKPAVKPRPAPASIPLPKHLPIPKLLPIPKPAVSTSGSTKVRASDINKLINNQKGAMSRAVNDEDNTYSVVGQDPIDALMDPSAQYSAVYSQTKSAQRDNLVDDTYDEVRM